MTRGKSHRGQLYTTVTPSLELNTGTISHTFVLTLSTMEVGQNVLHDIPIHHVSSFDIEDAFSDSDVDDLNYQFSPDVIREDMAEKFDTGGVETAEEAASNRFPVIQSPPFATIDLNGDGESSGSRFASRSPPSTDSEELSSEVDQVSPSTADKHPEEECEKHIDDLPTDNPYPNVIIDASAGQLHTNRISLTSEWNNSRGPTEHLSSPSSQSSSLPPHTAQSTRSLPTPTLISHQARQAIQSTSSTPAPVASPPPPLSTTDPTPLPSSSSAPPSSQSQPMQKHFTHRPTRSIGPSAFEKVRSKTRPNYLPPKPRNEDDKHMSDWESMMQQSRTAGQGTGCEEKARLLTSDHNSGKETKGSTRTSPGT
jgi:hypothetical protein